MKWGKVVESGENAMFMGTYEHTLDEKGRISIPSRFRELLSEKQVTERLIVTQGLDTCLFCYPLDEWKNFEAKIVSRPLNKGDDRYFVRRMLAGAVECPLDKQGRIGLPPNLRQYAGLEREAVVVGVSNRIEIWSPARWQEYLASGKTLEDIAEQIQDI
jgi:MraZ protein